MNDCSKMFDGSTKGMEKCPCCKKDHEVYREGPWDNEPVNCEGCQEVLTPEVQRGTNATSPNNTE